MSDRARIFVVDDSQESILLLEAILTHAGYAVRPVLDATSFFALIFAERPDLVLCDLRMPGLDGATLIGMLKKVGRRIPVLLCSGAEEAELALAAARCGADGYVQKNYPPHRVAHIVRRTLEEHRRAVVVE